MLRNRQPDGAEVDLDAMVARYATVRSGHAPDDRLYLARRRHQRELATLLLLLSDGKPTDYDRYAGPYGMADVRQALREAQHAPIHPYALAVDVQATRYLPQMFGRGHFQMLPHPAHLVRSLADLYRRLSG